MEERDLWVGADVRWVGPETERGGVVLRHGDRAVVVDAGRHHVTSFTALGYRPARTRLRRPGRGVVIRLADASELTVARRHLELVAPDHPLSPEPDGSHATWWVEQLAPWGRGVGISVCSLVPSSLPAVAQVLHPWDGEPEARSLTWRELAERLGFAGVPALDATRDFHTVEAAAEAGYGSTEGGLDGPTATALVDVLADHTTTPDDVFVAVWDGWGAVPPQRWPGAARVHTEGRTHVLLRGPLAGVLTGVGVSGESPGGGEAAAGLWWPADRAWFVATEIDFEWTFVAGTEELVEHLVADERLEVARTAFEALANRAVEPS